jgi:tRNA threonylcarbamoyl adenosine modification protein (Sua5/YciO/YrdC/YwlC family)
VKPVAVMATVESAALALSAGDVIVYPTETVYGLGVDPAARDGIRKLLRLKGRDTGRGISLMVADLAAARDLIAGPIPEPAMRLARAFWPGPLTLVLPAASVVPPSVVGGTGGVGLRCSSDPVCQALAQQFGRPFTSTSANPTGQPPATDVDAARRYFGSEITCYLDAGRRDGNAASSVVEFRRGKAYLIRAGAIPVQVLGGVVSLEPALDPVS